MPLSKETLSSFKRPESHFDNNRTLDKSFNYITKTIDLYKHKLIAIFSLTNFPALLQIIWM